MAKRLNKKRPASVDGRQDGEAREIGLQSITAFDGKIVAQALLILVSCLWIYWPALRGDWLWDDELLISQNAIVHDPSGWWKIWLEPGTLLDYQPIKVSMVWLQWQLWGSHTLGYHLTNVILHGINALLVWRLLGKFHLRLAWLGGLLFAVHPVQVESVAWMAELKNTLSLAPFLLAMCAYMDYEEHERPRDYFLALGLFLIAMLCKATMVMFPVVILLYVWWKRGRTRWKDVRASLPFFALSLVIGVITLLFLSDHAMGEETVPLGGFFSRLACAGLSISFYFSKCLWPTGLLPLYPQWSVDPPTPWQFLPWPILAAVVYWLWRMRARWGRHALLGLGFFIINLIPFLGFNAASYMSFTWVMDHLLYLPIIGLIGLVVAGLDSFGNLIPGSARPISIGAVAMVVALLAWKSHLYAGIFMNQTTLWSYTLQHTPGSWQAHNYLGYALGQSGKEAEAITELKQALALHPDYFEAHSNLGAALLQTGQVPEAIEQYEQALRLKPNNPKAHDNLGNAFHRAGRVTEAMGQYEDALRLDPNDAEAQNSLGFALQQSGHIPEAIERFERVIQAHPDDLEAHCNLGNALYQSGRIPEAVGQFEQALRIDPDNAETHYNLANVLLNLGQTTQAIEEFERTIKLKPSYAEAHCNLGVALLSADRATDAIEELKTALQIQPDYFEAHYNLGLALIHIGHEAKAKGEFEQALKLRPDDADTQNNLARLNALLKSVPAKK